MEHFSAIDLEPGRPLRGQISPWFWVVGVLAPFATAAALIPIRSDLAHSSGIILVLPVVIIAMSMGPWVGSVAAFSAALGFDLFLVAPYLHPGIDRSEDVVAMVALLCVGILAGVVGSRLSRTDQRSRERLRELTVLGVHAETITHDGRPEQLLNATARNLAELLNLRSCSWESKEMWDPRLTIGQPTMLDNGQIMGRLGDLPADRGKLPNPLELVVSNKETSFGRFVVEPGEGRTSIEERRIAMTLCRLTASRLASQLPVPQVQEQE